MASITNQWLKGSVLKERSHSPVTTKLSLEVEPNPLRHCVGQKTRMIFEKADGSHQIVTLHDEEILALLQFVVDNCDEAELSSLQRVLLRS